MANLIVDSIELKSKDCDLTVLTKCYTLSGIDSNVSPAALTLVFFHATGVTKEIWEPTILRILTQANAAGSKTAIYQVYSIECPNHGESAIINEKALDSSYKDRWSINEYAKAAKVFLTAGLEHGARVDFSQRRLVGIGHSYGGAALVMVQSMLTDIKFSSVIIIEGAINLPDTPERTVMSQLLTTLAWTRRDTWLTRDAAIEDLKRNMVYQSWDHRALDLFVQYGLRPHPASAFPMPYTFQGICTALSKSQEAACYRDEELVYRGMQEYAALTRRMPVHLIFGAQPDISPESLQEIQKDPKNGCYPASTTYIEDAGHLVVQQAPDKVADAILNILSAPRKSLL